MLSLSKYARGPLSRSRMCRREVRHDVFGEALYLLRYVVPGVAEVASDAQVERSSRKLAYANQVRMTLADSRVGSALRSIHVDGAADARCTVGWSGMIFAMSVPTCKEGLSLPTPFCSSAQVVRMCVRAEELGYHSVWGNDHITPPRYVRQDYPQPPNFYEPLITLACVAQATARIRLGTSVLVLPMREPVYLAKSVATLDQLSGGRFTLGVGVGAYREEFERLRPRDRRVNRAELMDESVQILRLLFDQRSASFEGKHYAFDGIELAPKPLQQPLPMFIAGNDPAGVRRAARWGQGWFPAALSLDDLRRGIDILHRECEAIERDPSEITIAPQWTCGIGRTHEAGVAQFRRSRMYTHLHTLGASTLRQQDLSKVEDNNLVGSTDEIVEKIKRMEEAGVTMLAAMSFTSNSYEELLDDMALFAEEVTPVFAPDATCSATCAES